MNKGITLIALIITIIVMLIIAGVSARLAIGDNSMISKAEIAKYENSITQIEQKLNEVYTENYEEVESKNLGELTKDAPVTKARALAYYLEDSLGENNNIFRKAKNSNGYTTNHEFKDDANAKGDKYAYVSSEGYIFYFLSPEKLKAFDSTLEILDLDEPDNRKTSNDLDNLYAVTSDLRVFVIENDIDSLIGIKKDDLSYYDFNSVIYKAGSDWANIFEKEEDVTYQDGQAKKSFTLDFSSTNVSDSFDFSGIGELKHLNTLTIKNCNLNSIKGIEESAETLTYLWIENCDIKDYSGLNKLTNLQYLYLYDDSQTEVDRILDKMQNVNYTKLSYLGVIGTGGWGDFSQGFTDERYYSTKHSKVTNIEKFKNLTDSTKKAVKYLFLTANNISDLTPLSGFSNLISIRADSNNIKSLEGLSNKPNLTTIRICNNNLTNLDKLENVGKLTWLDVRKNKSITNLNNISNITSLKKLWFTSETSLKRGDSDDKILDSEINNNYNFLIKLGTGLQIDPKYSKLLVDVSTTTRLELVGSIDESVFEKYENCKKLEKLSINNISIISSTTKQALSNEDTNKLINKVLKNQNLSTIKYLQIINMNDKMTSTEFLSNMKNLTEFDFRQNTATDIDKLAETPVKKLSIDNTNIDLTTDNMQNVISNLSKDTADGYWTVGAGLLLCNDSLYDQLKDCKKITKLYMYRDWRNGQVATTNTGRTVDLSACTNLTDFYSYYIYSNYILPSSVENVRFAQLSDNGIVDFRNCKENLTYIWVSDNAPNSALEKSLKTIPKGNKINKLEIKGQSSTTSDTSYSYLTSCNLDNLETLTITDSKTRVQRLNTLEEIAKLKSLKNITISWAPDLKTLCNLSELKNLQSLTITDSGLETISDVKLQSLPNLTTLNFNNNNLTNLYGLVVNDEANDFKKLSSLSLQNNNLEDQFSMGVASYNIESKIFVPLHQKALRKLYISGNSFTGFSQINKLQWSGKSGF